MALYSVGYDQYRKGFVLVEAASKEEALEKATSGDVLSYQEDSFSTETEFDEKDIQPENPETWKKELKR
jgi:hypothetical protein